MVALNLWDTTRQEKFPTFVTSAWTVQWLAESLKVIALSPETAPRAPSESGFTEM
jgi:hypothetical protein